MCQSVWAHVDVGIVAASVLGTMQPYRVPLRILERPEAVPVQER
jgi:hypothetical protein